MTYFECKVKYDRMTDAGVLKPVTETYAMDAMSFTEAEARVTELVSPQANGEFAVVAEKIAQYKDYVDVSEGDRYYMVKFNIVTIDERTAVEKKTPSFVLFRDSDIDHVKDTAHFYMKSTAMDYEIAAIKETKIVDVFIGG